MRRNVFTANRVSYLLAAALLCAGTGLSAWAFQPDDVLLSVRASSSLGSALYELRYRDLPASFTGGDDLMYGENKPVALRAGQAEIGTLSEFLFGYGQPDAAVFTDGLTNPRITLQFAVQSGTSDTEFVITSALLSFSPMVNPEGRASAAFTVTDGREDGAVLTGLHPGVDGPRGFLATYNGLAPAGTAFSRLISGVTALPESSQSAFENDPVLGRRGVVDTVSSMSTQIRFMLSAGDSASGTTNYELFIPEPSTLALLALGLFGLRRR